MRAGWIFLLIGSFLLGGCDREERNTDPRQGEYRHALDGAVASLDPAHSATVNAKFIVVNLYQTLYRYKYLARPYELTPNLAAAMPEVSADGKTYTIKIREGNYFHDDVAFTGGKGREVVAADFIYSIKRQLDPATRAQGAWLWRGQILGLQEWAEAGADYDQDVAGLRAPDRYTLEIELENPNPLFTHSLAQGFAAIVPREAVEHWGREFASHPVGSGPYQLVSLDTTRAVLRRNPNYRRLRFSLEAEGGSESQHPRLVPLDGRYLPLSERVELAFIKDDTARWNALLGGSVDSILAPSTLLQQILLPDAEDFQLQAELASRFDMLASQETGFVHIDFNLDNPEIGYHPDPERQRANHALRCAIRSGYDWQARNRVFSRGTAKVFAGVIPPVVAEFDPQFAPDSIRRDVDAAKRLLADHGWNADNLPVLNYGFAASVTENQMFEQFRGFLLDIGYPADKIRPRKFATFGDYVRAMNESDLNILPAGWEMDFPDALDTLALFYGPNRTPGANRANFSDPEFDRLFEQARLLPPDAAQRKPLIRRMNEIVTAACVSISGLTRTRIFLWDKNILMVPDRGFTQGYYLPFAGRN